MSDDDDDDDGFYDALSHVGSLSTGRGDGKHDDSASHGSSQGSDEFDFDIDDDNYDMDADSSHMKFPVIQESSLPPWVFDIEECDDDILLATTSAATSPRNSNTMNRSHHNNSSNNNNHDDDDDDDHKSMSRSIKVTLLEELEIDVAQITYTMIWMMKCPFFCLLKRVTTLPSCANSQYVVLRTIANIWGRVIDYNNHPIQLDYNTTTSSSASHSSVSTVSDSIDSKDALVLNEVLVGESPDVELGRKRTSSACSNGLDDSDSNRKESPRRDSTNLSLSVKSGSKTPKPADFWGPCLVVTGYCSLLWLAGQDDVPYVYIIWLSGAILNHLTIRPYLNKSTILFHLSILGYSLVPMIFLCLFIILGRLPLWLSTVIEIVAVLWSSFAATMSYNMILRKLLLDAKDKERLVLLVPLTLVFQFYVISLLPTRSWQINNGERIKILS